MAVRGFDKLKFCGDGGGDDDGNLAFKRHNSCERNNTWHSGVRRQVSYDDFDFGYDDDDVPLAVRLSRMPNSGTRSGICDVPVQKRGNTTTMPVKRLFVNSNALQNSVKKSKVTANDNPLTVRIKIPGKVADKSFLLPKKDLALVEKSFEECKSKRQVEEKRLTSIKRDIEECSKELVNLKKKNSCVERISESHKKMLGKIDECVKDSVAKEAQLCLMDDLIGERKRELKKKEIELHQVMDNIVKHREGKEEELKALTEKIAQCSVELKAKEKECDAMKKQIEEQADTLKSENKKLLKVMMQLSQYNPRAQMKEFESTKKQFEEQVKELELKEKRCGERVMELESKEKVFQGCVEKLRLKEKRYQERVVELESNEKLFEVRVKELEFKEKQLEGQAKEFELKVERFHNQIKELESEKKHFDSCVKELESKERQFEGQAKRLELKEEQLEGRAKELDSKEKMFKDQVKDLELKENKLEALVNEFKSEKEQFEGGLKVLRFNEKFLEVQVKKFKGRVDRIESKEDEFNAKMQELKRFISRMEDFNSEEEQFEGRGKELESIDKTFKVHANEFEQKEKLLESKQNEFDGQHKQPELREKQCVAVIQPFEEETDLSNQLSPTIDGRCLMLVPCEQTDEFESFDCGFNLQSLSDPSKNVLEIIQNPIFPKCKMGNSAVIIDDRDILLLEELMRISPDVKPQTREKAMELALELKANMEENAENSKVVLGFLLLLSVYGLVPSFDEDEVLKLFELVSQQKIAIVLFGALGFADKISDFVENLITRQQYVEAVRFSCAYNLGDNNQLVALLQEHVQNAKLISESCCNEANSVEIKDKARDQEIVSLRAVLQCIEDNNLESEDTRNTIHNRILELKRQTGK